MATLLRSKDGRGRFTPLRAPECLEPRAAPGGGVLEIFLGVPFLTPFLGSPWADSNPTGAIALPGLSARCREHLDGMTELRQEPGAMLEILGETRRLLAIAGASQATAEDYVSVVQTRLGRTADALIEDDPAELASSEFLRDLWWDDELLSGLAAALASRSLPPQAAASIHLPPVAEADSYRVGGGSTLPAESVLANDWDPLDRAISS